MSGWIPDRTSNLGIHELAWFTDQLGNGAAAVFDGNCRFRFNGNDPDASDQLSGAWSNPESVGTGGRGGDDRMLL